MPQPLTRARPELALAGLALGLALAACGGGAAASAGTPGPQPSGAIAVEAKEYSFTPSTITMTAGSVTFSIHNGGNEEHEFEILQGDVTVDEIEGIVPGLTKTLTKDLAAGEYTFQCALNGHDQLGMKGTLTVTAG